MYFWSTNNSQEDGFTLLEVLVVMGSTILITTFLISSFARSRIDLTRAANTIAGDIRQAEEKAVSSAKYSGTLRCGYGINIQSANSYRMYTTPTAGATCSTQDRDYGGAGDSIVATYQLSDSKLVIAMPVPDIFFEPPDPRTYVCNSNPCGAADAGLGILPARITISAPGTNCVTNPNQCRSVCVYTSGKIETVSGQTCP